MRCICANIVVFVLESDKRDYFPPEEYSCFNDESATIGETVSPRGDALLKDVLARFALIHTETQMEYECMVVALIYMERLPQLTKKKFRICSVNWKYYMYTCMLLASKIWDDFAVNNYGFSTIFDDMSLAKTNEMELQLLLFFSFDVEVPCEKYFRLDETIKRLIFAADLSSQLQAFCSNAPPDTATHKALANSPLAGLRSPNATPVGDMATGGMSQSNSDNNLARLYLEASVPMTEGEARAHRELRGSRSSKEELLSYLTRTVSGDCLERLGSPIMHPRSPLSYNGLGPLVGRSLSGSDNTAIPPVDDRRLHQVVLARLQVREGGEGVGDDMGEESHGADDSEVELEESYDDFRDSVHSSHCVTMEPSGHHDSTDSHDTSPTAYQISNRRRDSIERRVSKAISVLIPSFPSLRLHNPAKIYATNDDVTEGTELSELTPGHKHFPEWKAQHAVHNGSSSSSGSIASEVKEDKNDESELDNIEHFPMLGTRPRAYTMTAAAVKVKPTPMTSGSSTRLSHSRRRSRMPPIDSTVGGNAATVPVDSAFVLASMDSMEKEVDEVLRKLTGEEGGNAGVGGQEEVYACRKKNRSVSYTNAKSTRHEAYDYRVVQSKK